MLPGGTGGAAERGIRWADAICNGLEEKEHEGNSNARTAHG
jgi:hypothetical protein